MASTSSMLCEKPKVHFGLTQEWEYEESETELQTECLTHAMAKENDGPNEYSIFKGRILSGFILKQYTDAAGLIRLYGQETLFALGEYLERDIDRTISHISENQVSASYYMDYRFTRDHIPRLKLLKCIIHLINLDARFNRILGAHP